MIDRRQVLTMGGLLGALVPASEVSAEGIGNGVGQQLSDKTGQDAVTALKTIATTILGLQSFGELAGVRKSQFDYLRGTGKFPDFIDVSADIWLGVHDWHIRMQQPLVLGRDLNGRYTLALGFTTLVMRHDAAPNFISAPYDNR